MWIYLILHIIRLMVKSLKKKKKKLLTNCLRIIFIANLEFL